MEVADKIVNNIRSVVGNINKLTIKSKSNDSLNEFLLNARDECQNDENYSLVSIVIDKNPNSMG